MWAERAKSVDNVPIKLGMLNFDIRGVQVGNNTPAYLFLGRIMDLNRDSAMIVVEPYSDYQSPVHIPVGGDFYAAHGVTVGSLPPNSITQIRYTNDLGVQLANRRYGRNIVIPLYNGPSGAASCSAPRASVPTLERWPTPALTSQRLRLGALSTGRPAQGRSRPPGQGLSTASTPARRGSRWSICCQPTQAVLCTTSIP